MFGDKIQNCVHCRRDGLGPVSAEPSNLAPDANVFSIISQIHVHLAESPQRACVEGQETLQNSSPKVGQSDFVLRNSVRRASPSQGEHCVVLTELLPKAVRNKLRTCCPQRKCFMPFLSSSFNVGKLHRSGKTAVTATSALISLWWQPSFLTSWSSLGFHPEDSEEPSSPWTSSRTMCELDFRVNSEILVWF